MVWLWKIMFDLVIIMSVGVLISLGGAVEKNRLCKNKQKVYFLKIKKAYLSWQKSYCCHATFVSLDRLLSFLKGHFFLQRFLPFLICFCFVCLFVCHTLFTFFTGLFAPTFRSPMSKLLDIWNPWEKVMERSGLRYEPTS